MMESNRKATKEIRIGSVRIGNGHPVLIQSMTNTPTEDAEKTLEQIRRLEAAGCEIIRCTVPTMDAAHAFRKIRDGIHIPLVADIHFDYRLAIAAMENGADKVRINPGNIGSAEKVREVVCAAKDHAVPIRIGVNSGSLEKEILERYGRVCAEALAESAMNEVHALEDQNFDNIVVSLKSSNVQQCVDANRILSEACPYPLHIGITESGTVYSGSIKSAVGLGILLNEGIGDTIRVSLTGDPVQEIDAAKEILRAAGLRTFGIEMVSCPTCGRTKIDLIGLAEKVSALIRTYPYTGMKVAVMGCVVNGPGEASEADLGIAGGDGVGLLFRKGQILKKMPEEELLGALKAELDHWNEGKEKEND